MKKLLLTIQLSLTIILLHAQNSDSIEHSSSAYNPILTPNTYQSSANPYYWKNRRPFADYWQQDVYYNIKAIINEQEDIIDATEELTYWNNSPDTLYYVFFHLYQNAFQPQSYYDNLHANNKIKPVYGKYEKKGLGTEVLDIRNNDQKVRVEMDNTIMKVFLPQPLYPNTSTTFHIKFKTYFDKGGDIRRRMKVFNSGRFFHYDGVHWYPRISVYDRKFGWTTDQHLGREFYGDYGCFDVELTFANNYIVEATGFLQNREEVLPDTLREKLEIKKFKDKPWGEKASIIIKYDSLEKKTWKYHAENVHDFAFTADPNYRIGEYKCLPFTQAEELDSITVISVCQEPHASGWQNAAEFAGKVIQVYSRDFGMYAYPKMVVADAQDGMEYPMLTLDGGKDPSYRGLLAHEVGHNWFYGMVGNNETYRACLDEGFTQFLTAWSMMAIDGEYFEKEPSKSNYLNKFKKAERAIDSRAYLGYLNDAIRENDATLNTHSDDYGGAIRHGGGYRHVYYKTATMLFNLQYVLGDSLFSRAMQHYFDQWKICHPYIEDFRNSIIQYTKVDLNWFFDQWFETTKNIDYKVAGVKKGKKENEYIIQFKRKGQMQMPLDFTVYTTDNQQYSYHIPNTWFEKKTDATILPRWIGWGNKLNPTYEANISIPGKIKDIVIDTTKRLADVYMPDNSKKCPTTLSFDAGLRNQVNRRVYEMQWRPDIWYNSYDGLKAGLHLKGDYMNYKHIFHLTAWYNSSLAQGGYDQYDFAQDVSKYNPFSFVFGYRTGIEKISKNTFFDFSAKYLDGLYGLKVGIDKDLNDHNSIAVNYKMMYRADSSDLNYLLYSDLWQPAKFNNTFNAIFSHSYQYHKGAGRINIELRSSSILSDYDFSNLTLSAINHTNVGKLKIRTRFVARFGTGNNVPLESSLYMSGGSPEEMMDNKYTRSKGFFPTDWTGYGTITNHFQYGGGLNLRGYAGYAAVDSNVKDGNIYEVYKSNSGIGLNAEIDLDKLVRFKPKALAKTFGLDVYLFGDAGVMIYEKANGKNTFAYPRIDAGLGTALTIKRFWVLETPRPLTIRFDMPFFLNRTPFAEPDYLRFRWVLGINRVF